MVRPPTSRRAVLQTLGLAGVGALGAGSFTAAALANQDGGAAATSQDDGAASPPPDASDWPSYQGDAGNRGYNPNSGGLSTPLSRWETEMPNLAAGPIVGPEHIYLATNRGQIVAAERAAGSIDWVTDLDGEVAWRRDETVLALGDGKLIATVGAAVHALDPVDGTVRWRTEVEGNETSGPTVADGTVYCLTDHGVLVALEADTGSQIWRLETGFEAISIYNGSLFTPALSPDGSIAVVPTNDAIHAVATADGTRQWRTPMDPAMTPVVDDAVYVTDEGGVTSLSLADGSVRWERRFDDDPDTTPVLAHGQVFVQQYPSGVIALDAATGHINWQSDVRLGDRRPTLVADADHLYVPVQYYGEHNADVIDEIVALDPADGTEAWRQTRRRFDQTDNRVQHLVPVDGGLFALHDSQNVLRLESRPPGVRWRTDVVEDPDHTVVAGDGVIYATTTAGGGDSITAIEPDTGAVRWQTDDTVSCRPVAAEGRVVTAGSTLQARTGTDGSVAWETPLPASARTDVLHQDGTLYVGWGNDPAGLSAVDATDGSVCWTIGGSGGDVYRVGSLAAVVGDTVIADVDEGLTGFAMEDGSRQWDRDARVTWLAAGEEVALSAFRGTIRALSPDGDVVWRRTLPNPVTGLAVRDGTVMARTSGDSGRYRGLSTTDGTVRWTLTADGATMTLPQFADGRWYAGTGNGDLLAIDPADGTSTTTASGFHGLHDRPAISGETVAVPSDEGFIYGFAAGE